MKYLTISMPFAAALLFASPLAAETAPQRVEVVLANFSFTPSAIKLNQGQRVTLHFVNNGSGGHDFTAPEFFKASMMDTAMRSKLGSKGKVSLQSGASMDVTLTPKVGSYKAKCSHFLHAGFGMTGTITVS